MKYRVDISGTMEVEASSPAEAVAIAKGNAIPVYDATPIETVHDAAKRGFKELTEGTPMRGSGK